MSNPAQARRPVIALFAAALFLLAGCNDTTKISSWTAPGVTHIHFNKVFIVALARQDLNRRIVEYRVQSQITKIPSVVSNEVLPGALTKADKDRVLKAIEESGCDGLITLRLTSQRSEVSRSSNVGMPMEYMVYSDYYSSVYDVGAYYTAAESSVNEDKIYLIEANIYDVKTKKLIWSGVTESTKDNIERQNVGAVAIEVAQKLKAMLQDDQLIK